MKPALVVIGNGMAGMRTVEELLKLAPDLYDITVFGAEPHGNYNRILLSPVLAGEKNRRHHAQHARMVRAARHHPARRRPGGAHRPPQAHRARASGLEVRYDRLLIATGSKPFIIPVPGHQLTACWPSATSRTWKPCWRWRAITATPW
jgi:nitrite reductase (NADH) large subunit